MLDATDSQSVSPIPDTPAPIPIATDALRRWTLPARPPSNLPIPLTSFIGREREMAQVEQLLCTLSTRLLTLTGAGGCGKTRLALAIAADLAAEFADGVWWVDLAGLSNPSLVPQAVAFTVGIREQPGRSTADTLADYLRPQHVLLVLDNCEHLVHACTTLADALLHVSPHLQILVTSREALGITGEMTWPVPSLSLPDPQHLPLVEQLASCEAIRLFVARATAVQSMFELTDQNAAAVAQVCQRLDGIPLAIELAAARVKVLTVQQIAARLDDRFTLLTTGSRTAPARQQTLKAALDWSYDLLTAAEQALLRRLSVFTGGCTLAAVEVVCTDESLSQGEILDLLAHLVDKSLVVMQPHGDEARYRLLETLRQYGWDRLREAGETEAVRRRHAALFLALAAVAAPELDDTFGREVLPVARLRRLEAEHDNLRAALDWCLGAASDADVIAGLRAAGGLMRFWEMRNDLREGRERLVAFLQHPAAAERTLPRAKAAHAAGRLAREQGDYVAARSFLEEGLAIFREVHDQRGIAMSLILLAPICPPSQDDSMERSPLEEGLAIFRALGDKYGIALSLTYLARHVADRGDFGRATALAEEALALFRDLDDTEGIVFARYVLEGLALHQGDYARAAALNDENLALLREFGDQAAFIYNLIEQGHLALAQGDVSRADRVFEECLALAREAGLHMGIAMSLSSLGVVAALQDDYVRATALLKESLRLYRSISNRWGIGECLEKLAVTACGQARREPNPALFVRAAQLLGSAEALRAVNVQPMAAFQRIHYERAVVETQAALGVERFVLEKAQGRGMPLEAAIAYALTEPPPGETAQAPGFRAPRQARRQSLGGLTRRESEVAILVAKGKSNRAIASELVVSVRAVEANITRILAKLGFTSRAQIAAWAVDIGLAQAPLALDTQMHPE